MNNPIKVLIFGDVAVPTGFGRIGAAIGKYLVAHGYQVLGACIQYDGLLPPPTGVPFFVASLAGKDHGQAINGIYNAFRPDVVLSLQDFPYHLMLHEATGIDWSTTAHVVITPIDGAPVAPEWLSSAKTYDSLFTISEFGVTTLREAGQRALLCPPGVDATEFRPLPSEERAALRAKLDIPTDGYVVGVMAMNQGRKDFPAMLSGFGIAFKDVPNAYLYLDCDDRSPAGWWQSSWLFPQIGIDPARVRFREAAIRSGVISLNERYNLLDQHMVISMREGFGLPHIEALAAGVPTCSTLYCSGPEVTQDGTVGLLVKAEPFRPSTWGGAMDWNADIVDLAAKLRWAYEHPAERAVMRERGLEYAKSRTWEKATAVVEQEIRAVLEKRGKK